MIVNLFSGVEVPLFAKQRTTPTIEKIAFSEAPTSKRCILAAAFPRCLAVCRVGCRQRGWWTQREFCLPEFDGIAFYHGKLYGLLFDGIVIFDVRMTKRGSPVITTTYMLSLSKVHDRTSQEGSKIGYIVKHNDKLLVAVKARWSLEHEHFFKVFEPINTDSTDNNYNSWTEVTTLDDHALFLGATCSKVVHVPIGRCGGIEGNHIYYNYIEGNHIYYNYSHKKRPYVTPCAMTYHGQDVTIVTICIAGKTKSSVIQMG